MTKTFRDNCDKNIVQQTSSKSLLPDVQMQSKMYCFVPFVRPCMHHKYGGISESHASKFLTFAKFLTYYFLLVILLLRVKK